MSSIIQDKTILNQVSEKSEPNEETLSILQRLEAILSNNENGIGLSAIQIGIPKKISVIKQGDGSFLHLINPEIVDKIDPFTFHGEGCLSFPGIFLETQRYQQITITNQVLENNSFREEKLCFYYSKEPEAGSDGLITIAVQHEMDHHLGQTILDYGKPIKKPVPITRTTPKIGRNDPCPCGKTDANGKILKYKKCCFLKE